MYAVSWAISAPLYAFLFCEANYGLTLVLEVQLSHLNEEMLNRIVHLSVTPHHS